MIDPEEIYRLIRKTDRDAEHLRVEAKVRFDAAGDRFLVDAEFHYKVLTLTAAFHRMHPYIAQDVLLQMATESIIMIELTDAHLAGQV